MSRFGCTLMLLAVLLWLAVGGAEECLQPPAKPGIRRSCVSYRRDEQGPYCTATCFCAGNTDGGFYRRAVTARGAGEACADELERQCGALRQKGCR